MNSGFGRVAGERLDLVVLLWMTAATSARGNCQGCIVLLGDFLIEVTSRHNLSSAHHFQGAWKTHNAVSAITLRPSGVTVFHCIGDCPHI